MAISRLQRAHTTVCGGFFPRSSPWNICDYGVVCCWHSFMAHGMVIERARASFSNTTYKLDLNWKINYKISPIKIKFIGKIFLITITFEIETVLCTNANKIAFHLSNAGACCRGSPSTVDWMDRMEMVMMIILIGFYLPTNNVHLSMTFVSCLY